MWELRVRSIFVKILALRMSMDLAKPSMWHSRTKKDSTFVFFQDPDLFLAVVQ